MSELHLGNTHSERVYSVFEIAQGLKRTIESATAGFWVEGEVGRLTRASSGHLYFTLKDEKRDAALDCVMWARDAARSGRCVFEGARVQLRGRATFYPPRGRLQWTAEIARPAGQGALLEALEKLRKKLIAEGLTDPERKRRLPTDPRVVGVVTSDSGAAFSDICTVASRRGPVRIVLSPSLVQGEGAPESIVRAIDLVERMPELDVLVVGRGGGSREDLMAFDDERVVRRIAVCRVPVVSAVGHEVDMSLADLVADARAATPSEAAELVVPDDSSRRDALGRAVRHLAQSMHARATRERVRHESLRRRLGDPRFVLAEHQQMLDERLGRLERAMRTRLARRTASVAEARRRLGARHPRAVIAEARADLNPLGERLRISGARLVEPRRSRLSEIARALSALSPLSILGRGYALATTSSGDAVRHADQLQPGEAVTVRVERGAFVAEVQKIEASVENGPSLDQESLSASPKCGVPESDA